MLYLCYLLKSPFLFFLGRTDQFEGLELNLVSEKHGGTSSSQVGVRREQKAEVNPNNEAIEQGACVCEHLLASKQTNRQSSSSSFLRPLPFQLITMSRHAASRLLARLAARHREPCQLQQSRSLNIHEYQVLRTPLFSPLNPISPSPFPHCMGLFGARVLH